MTTIIIKKEKFNLDDKILQDLGYVLKKKDWRKKVEMSRIREEIERLHGLKITDVLLLLD